MTRTLWAPSDTHKRHPARGPEAAGERERPAVYNNHGAFLSGTAATYREESTSWVSAWP